MTRWAKGTTEFVTVIVPARRARSHRVVVPLPIREKLGNPTNIMFKIQGNKIILKGVNK